MPPEFAFTILKIFQIVFICVMFFVFICVIHYCLGNRKQEYAALRNRYSGTPIAVTQVTTSTGVVRPPYPTNPLHPTPQSVQAPAPGFVPVGGYQTAPYPPAIVSGICYPAPVGATPGGTPYPPMSTPYPPTPYSPNQTAPPPSYTEAVGQNPVQVPPIQEQYAKQAPYNPNY